ELVEFAPAAGAHDLVLTVLPSESGLTLRFEFNRAAFDRSLVELLANRSVHIAEQLVLNPERTLESLRCEAAERSFWTDGAPAVGREPAAGIAERFHRWVSSTSVAIAIRHGDEQLTYAELGARVAGIARWLGTQGLAGRRVGLVGRPGIASV